MSTCKASWIILPVLDNLEQAIQALSDCCAQSIPTRVLVVNQGSSTEIRQRLERLAEEHDQIFLWSFDPALPSLSAVWNRALRFVWEVGGTEALVVNSDVRLHRDTYPALKAVQQETVALFVSGVGVAPEQFDAVSPLPPIWNAVVSHDAQTNQVTRTPIRGGPDFSCFLISEACHDRFPFDEGFIPAFCEDLDLHRRLMLAGEGSRIFSVNLPFLHYGSQTLMAMTPEKRAATERQITTISRAHYSSKWGGPVNQETFYVPYGVTRTWDPPSCGPTTPELPSCGPTTPELQAWVQSTVRTVPVPEP